MLFAQANGVAENTVDAVEPSKTALMDSFTQAFNQVVQLAPKVLAMIVVLVLGYLIARIVARAITVLSQKIGLQIAAERSGLADSMQHMGIKRNVPAIVGMIVFWLLMCVFIMAAVNILGLQDVSAAMAQRRELHSQAAGGDAGGRDRIAGGELSARRGGDQRRPRRPDLRRAPGQRLLLCAGAGDVPRGADAPGHEPASCWRT